MLLAGILAGCLFAALVASDWWRFSRPTVPAGRYGCPVARTEDILPVESEEAWKARFHPDDRLTLDHGIVRWFPDKHCILLFPQPSRSSPRFRTAWPLKGVIEVDEAGGRVRLRCVKLMPWSAAVLTLLWFAVVGIGTLAFVIRFLAGDDAFSIGSLLLVMGVTAVGLLVMVFGLVTVSLAYRLEDQRLMQAYGELRAVLAWGDTPNQLAMKSDKK